MLSLIQVMQRIERERIEKERATEARADTETE